jgi:hypothetical protein
MITLTTLLLLQTNYTPVLPEFEKSTALAQQYALQAVIFRINSNPRDDWKLMYSFKHRDSELPNLEVTTSFASDREQACFDPKGESIVYRPAPFQVRGSITTEVEKSNGKSVIVRVRFERDTTSIMLEPPSKTASTGITYLQTRPRELMLNDIEVICNTYFAELHKVTNRLRNSGQVISFRQHFTSKS